MRSDTAAALVLVTPFLAGSVALAQERTPAPAGTKYDHTGHHHLLIDTDPPSDLSTPLPATDKIVHFGKGQTETTLNLTPGKHTLQMVLADANHVPHSPPVISQKITITVKL